MVTRFVNTVMKAGKKSTAEAIVYGAIAICEQKAGQDGVAVLRQAMNNVKPNLEVKSRRVGGATYQVPVEIKPERRTALAFRWLIQSARSRPDKTMAQKLASEILAASRNEGGAIKKKEDTHRMAEANKAFAHYRF
jgi:small subunit ribosomal protein S7